MNKRGPGCDCRVFSVRGLLSRIAGQVVKRLNLRAPIRVNGRHMVVPLLGGIGFPIRQVDDVWLLDIFRRLLGSRQGAFIDVGMNLGHTLVKVMSLDPQQEYYGFDPNVACCSYVEELIRANGFARCEVYPIGLSDEQGIRRFHARGMVDVAGTLTAAFLTQAAPLHSRRVLVCKGDDILASLGVQAVSVIKIDVEGSELEVLRGLRESVRRYSPYLVCEVIPDGAGSDEASSLRREKRQQLEALLEDQGYAIFRMGHDGAVLPLDSIETTHDRTEWDYVFVPERELGAFARMFGVREQPTRPA